MSHTGGPRIRSSRAHALANLSSFLVGKNNAQNASSASRRRLQPPLRDVTDAALRGEEVYRFQISLRDSHNAREQLVILFAGATGSGKSATINSLVNFLYEVDFEDDIRFALPQREAGAGESVTRDVLIYELHDTRYEGVVITIVDTPGFADTQGPDQDRLALRRISEFLYYEQRNGSGNINAVCFTMDAHDCRYTVHTAYVYDQVCTLFTKTMQNNIFVVFTKDDGAEIKALAVLERAQIIVTNFVAVNNSGFFPENEGNHYIQKAKFEDGCEKFGNFLRYVYSTQPHDLTDLVKKLQAQEKLESDSDQLFRRILFEIENYEALLRNIKKLHLSDGPQKQRVFRIKTPGTFRTEIVQHDSPRLRSLVCERCQITCHRNCNHLFNLFCPVLSPWNKACKMCKCSVEQHLQVNFYYAEVRVAKEEVVIVPDDGKEDLIEKTLMRIVNKLRKSEMLSELKFNLKADLFETRRELSARIMKNQEDINALQLYQSIYNTSPQFVDQLIEKEMRTKSDGYQQNVAEFRRHRELMNLVKQTMSDDLRDPIEQFSEDLATTVDWLQRRMPEIGNWIRAKLREDDFGRKYSESSLLTADSGYAGDSPSSNRRPANLAPRHGEGSFGQSRDSIQGNMGTVSSSSSRDRRPSPSQQKGDTEPQVEQRFRFPDYHGIPVPNQSHHQPPSAPMVPPKPNVNFERPPPLPQCAPPATIGRSSRQFSNSVFRDDSRLPISTHSSQYLSTNEPRKWHHEEHYFAPAAILNNRRTKVAQERMANAPAPSEQQDSVPDSPASWFQPPQHDERVSRDSRDRTRPIEGVDIKHFSAIRNPADHRPTSRFAQATTTVHNSPSRKSGFSVAERIKHFEGR